MLGLSLSLTGLRAAGVALQQIGTCYRIERAPAPPPAPTVGAQTDYFCFEVTP